MPARIEFCCPVSHVSLPAAYAQLDGDRPSEICLLGFNVDLMYMLSRIEMFNEVDRYLSAFVQE